MCFSYVGKILFFLRRFFRLAFFVPNTFENNRFQIRFPGIFLTPHYRGPTPTRGLSHWLHNNTADASTRYNGNTEYINARNNTEIDRSAKSWHSADTDCAITRVIQRYTMRIRKRVYAHTNMAVRTLYPFSVFIPRARSRYSTCDHRSDKLFEFVRSDRSRDCFVSIRAQNFFRSSHHEACVFGIYDLRIYRTISVSSDIIVQSPERNIERFYSRKLIRKTYIKQLVVYTLYFTFETRVINNG